ncbi:MAG: hypothetical protein GXP55_09265 [Deltaproteobacteria bacterium]|nr:hypothetical protein [Deltaproteobacteria bacterium]
MLSLKEKALAALRGRRRVAPLVLVVAALTVGGVVFRAYPREVRIRYALGPDHVRVHDLWLSYQHDGELVRAAHFHYEDGAPERVFHTLELAAGRYVIQAELRGPDLNQDLSRALVAPAEGRVRIRLYEAPEAFARAHRELSP